MTFVVRKLTIFVSDICCVVEKELTEHSCVNCDDSAEYNVSGKSLEYTHLSLIRTLSNDLSLLRSLSLSLSNSLYLALSLSPSRSPSLSLSLSLSLSHSLYPLYL